MNISVASSISAYKNFDPMDTLDFCISSGINFAQLYMDKSLEENPLLIDDLAKIASDNGITLTCHAPGLHTPDISDKTLTAIARLLKLQVKKVIITHFDENSTPLKSRDVVEKINGFGLTVGLENFYRNCSIEFVNKNITDYIETIKLSRKNSIIPVADIPRLFIESISKNADSLDLTKKLLSGISNHSDTIILHLIDFSDYSQSRDSWVEIGKGLMPYKEIFASIYSLGMNIDHTVLEFEGKKFIPKSIISLSTISD